MGVEICCFELGPLMTNTYLVTAGDEWMLVDPTWGADAVARELTGQASGGRIVLTHGHADHIAGIDEVRDLIDGIEVWCPEADAAMLTDASANLSALAGMQTTPGAPDHLLRPGQVMELGGSRWQVLDTSGHTAGGISLYCQDASTVIVGDALFAGSIGRTDFPGGSMHQLRRSIRDHLLSLPSATRVLPGHGPETTIQEEIESNGFLIGLV